MIKKYFPILILSAVCLAACSKKGEEVTAESPSPIMAVVNEAPAAEDKEGQDKLRDPMDFVIPNSAVLAKQSSLYADRYEVEKMMKKLSDEDIAHSQAEYEKAVEEIKKLKNVKEASVSTSGISVHYDDGKEKFLAMYLLPTPVDAPPAPLAAGLVSY